MLEVVFSLQITKGKKCSKVRGILKAKESHKYRRTWERAWAMNRGLKELREEKAAFFCWFTIWPGTYFLYQVSSQKKSICLTLDSPALAVVLTCLLSAF